MPIFTIRTTSGREDTVIDLLESNVKSESLDVKSIFHPAEIKGYIFVEGSLGVIQKAMRGLMHAKGLIEKPVRMDEIQHFLEHKKTMINVSEGDTVEIIGGPFKGERGEVKRIDKVKDEVTLELLEASIPIPVTIATEFIKIIKKVKSDEIPESTPRPSTPEPTVTEPSEEKEADEGSAFDLKALKERDEARKGPEEEEPAAGEKAESEEPKPAVEKETMKEEPKEEKDKDEGFMGGILEELEREEKEKKKKRMKDLEYLEVDE